MLRRFAPMPVLVIIAVAGLAACGDDRGDLSSSDVEGDVRAAIESGGFDSSEIDDVSCPSGQPREDGHSFECTATVGGEDVTVAIDQDDGAHVATAVYKTASVEDTVETQYFHDTAVAVSADCSTAAAIVVAIGSTFDCTLTAADGATLEVSVTSQTAGAYLLDAPPFPS